MWIQTYSGVAFDLVNPTRAMVRWMDIVHALPLVHRFLGHTSFPISVADHSLRVARIVERLGGSPEDIRAGLAHDFAEVYVGDMPSPLKLLVPAFKDVERRVWAAIAERFDLPVEMPQIVKHADMLALHDEHKCCQGPAPAPWGIPGFDELPVFERHDPATPDATRAALRVAMGRWGIR